MRTDSNQKKRSFSAMPPDVRWRLCPTVGDASKAFAGYARQWAQPAIRVGVAGRS